jgi:N-acetylmuramoyl-L-alanine amidase
VNGLRNPNVLSVGTRLRTPGGRTVRPIAVTVSGPAASGAYVVRPGDTLGAIAARLRVSQATLARLNALRNPNVLSVGTRLRTPGALGAPPAAQPAAPSAAPSSGFTGTYVVRQGDTLAAIAARVGASQGAVARANGIRDPDVLVAGTTLRVPAGVPGAVTVVAQAPEQRVVIPGPYPTRSEVAGLIAAAAGRFGVDVALVRAVAWQESGWYQGAVSPTGALGIMQLQPGTASWVGPSLVGRTIDPMAAADNVAGGAALIAWLLRQTAGDRALALAGYYQGLASVRQRGMLKDTQGYVAAVTSLIGRV